MWEWVNKPQFLIPDQDSDYGIFPGDPSLGVLLAFSSSTATATTSSTPTTTTTIPPKPTIDVSVATLGSRNNIVTMVSCAGGRCSGTLEPTKTVTTKVDIGHSKSYTVRTTVEVLGKIRYAMAEGSQRRFSIQLNAAGVKLLQAANARRLICELTVTSAFGVKRESVLLRTAKVAG